MGADAPNEVEETIDQSDKFLANNIESDWEDLNETQQKQVLEWKDTLDEFNNGEYTDGEPEDWWKEDEEESEPERGPPAVRPELSPALT